MLPAIFLALTPPPDLPGMITRFSEDEASLQRSYRVEESPWRRERFRKFYEDQRKQIESLDLKDLPEEDQVDAVLLDDHVVHELNRLDAEATYARQTEPLLPFAPAMWKYEEDRRLMRTIDSAKTASGLAVLATTIKNLHKKLADELDKHELQITNGVEKASPSAKLAISRSTANRALHTLAAVRGYFEHWFAYYNGYDPMFTWWNEAPRKDLLAAFDDYVNFVRDRLVGIKADDKTTIIGFPIGRQALMDELRVERIPYTPEELISIADKQYAWCLAQMKNASRELGYGDDWKKALEHVKQQFVEPGKQPALIRSLTEEAMMSPESQLQSPFFLGGEYILVSFPTNAMSQEAKMMSLRGNNRYFARATVFHELIPGHHLQMYMLPRFRPYRQTFYTPFWIEGWALYWEMLMWDLGFARTPEERIGMLFWRMHRCARITFSLSFHLGKMTPQQCVDLLVDHVGHERDNALAEVRRSLSGDYGPLYQSAYMLGGLQFMSLKRELVDTHKMTFKAFHDAILRNGPIPVDFDRAILTGAPVKLGANPAWRFAD
jgi:uncharacterized protein (DUF885 family)